MKTHLLPAAAVAIILAGCGDKTDGTKQTTNATSTGGSPLTAPVDYLGAVAKGQQNAVKTVDTASITKAIQLFGVDHGRNPKDLNELVQEKYLPQVPAAPYGTKILYDANAGTVTIQKQ